MLTFHLMKIPLNFIKSLYCMVSQLPIFSTQWTTGPWPFPQVWSPEGYRSGLRGSYLQCQLYRLGEAYGKVLGTGFCVELYDFLGGNPSTVWVDGWWIAVQDLFQAQGWFRSLNLYSSYIFIWVTIFGRGIDPEWRETKEDLGYVEKSRSKISGLKFDRAGVGVSRWSRQRVRAVRVIDGCQLTSMKPCVGTAATWPWCRCWLRATSTFAFCPRWISIWTRHGHGSLSSG